VTLTSDHVTLAVDLWPWTFAAYRQWRVETLYQIWTQSNNPRRNYCDFSVWPHDLEHCVTCFARLSDNFHQVWPSITYPCPNLSVFWCWYVLSCCDLDVWPVDFESSCYIKRHVVKVCTEIERNRAIPGWIIDNFVNFCTRYAMLWPLAVDLLTLNFYSTQAVMYRNSVQNLSEIE